MRKTRTGFMMNQQLENTLQNIRNLLSKEECNSLPEMNEKIQKLGEIFTQLEVQIQKGKKEAKFCSSVLSSLPDLVSYLDLDLNYIYVNEAYERWFGVTQKQCLEGSVYTILGEAAVLKVRKYLDGVMSGKPQDFKCELPYSLGGTKIVHVKYLPDFDEHGKVIGIIAIVQKLSESISNDRQIKLSKSQLHGILDASPSIIFVKDLQGRFLLCNQTYASILKKKKNEVIGKTVFELFPKETAHRIFENDQEIAKTGNPKIVEEQIHIGDVFRWSLVTLFPLKDESEEVYAVGGIITDIQEKKQADLELLEQKKLFEIVVENLPVAVFLKDAQDSFRVKLWNRAAERIFEIPRETILGKTTHDLWPKEDADHYLEDDNRVMSSGNSLEIDETTPTKTKGTKYLKTRKLPLTLNQNKSGKALMVICEDITDYKRLQLKIDQERSKLIHTSKLASLGEMSAGIAHEINNPLTVVNFSVDLLSKFTDNPEKFTLAIKRIRAATLRITKIVSGLKKFSRTSEEAAHQVEALNTILAEVKVIAEIKSKRDSVPITWSTEEGLNIFCDSMEIEQVLINLINNGIDEAKNKQKKWVKINSFSERQKVVIQVIDSGTGIPDSVAARLFQPFFTTKPVGKGTGLGLSISKGILDQHNASIEINRSLPNTCFEIRFPKI
jgi:PAS domain S-box-containing protein